MPGGNLIDIVVIVCYNSSITINKGVVIMLFLKLTKVDVLIGVVIAIGAGFAAVGMLSMATALFK